MIAALPSPGAEAASLKRRLRRRFVAMAAAILVPTVLASAGALGYYHLHAISVRFSVAFGDLGANFGALETALGRMRANAAPDRRDARVAYVDALTLYGALRASDMDGVAAVDKDEEPGDALREIYEVYRVDPVAAAARRGLAGHDMPEALENAWEADETAGGEAGAGDASLESAAAEFLVMVEPLIAGRGELRVADDGLIGQSAEFARVRLEPALREIDDILDAQTRVAATIPSLLTGAVTLSAILGLAGAYVFVYGPLSRALIESSEALRAIRATPATADTPVTLLSSLEDGPAIDAKRARALDGAPTEAPEPAPIAAAVEVLIVDDNDVNRMVAEETLDEIALSHASVEDGAQAVAAFERLRPRVILMDVSMPVMDGFEATRRIREIEAARGLPRTPIVGLTAHAMDGDRERCLAAGMDAYLAKPLASGALLFEVDRWIGPEADAARARAAGTNAA